MAPQVAKEWRTAGVRETMVRDGRLAVRFFIGQLYAWAIMQGAITLDRWKRLLSPFLHLSHSNWKENDRETTTAKREAVHQARLPARRGGRDGFHHRAATRLGRRRSAGAQRQDEHRLRRRGRHAGRRRRRQRQQREHLCAVRRGRDPDGKDGAQASQRQAVPGFSRDARQGAEEPPRHHHHHPRPHARHGGPVGDGTRHRGALPEAAHPDGLGGAAADQGGPEVQGAPRRWATRATPRKRRAWPAKSSGAATSATSPKCIRGRGGGFARGIKEWPAVEPVPATLDWDLWTGRAAEHTYSSKIHPINWRGFLEYGTQMVGDWGIHMLGPANWALQLGSPTSVECTGGGRSEPGDLSELLLQDGVPGAPEPVCAGREDAAGDGLLV